MGAPPRVVATAPRRVKNGPARRHGHVPLGCIFRPTEDMPMRAAAIVAVFVVSSAAAAVGLKVSEAEFNTYVSLFNARALSEARRMYAGTDATKKAQAQAEYQKTLGDAGWTEEKVSEVGRE